MKTWMDFAQYLRTFALYLGLTINNCRSRGYLIATLLSLHRVQIIRCRFRAVIFSKLGYAV